MYAKTIYYRIYSIATLVISIISALFNIIYTVPLLDNIFIMVKKILPISSDISQFASIIKILIIISSLLTLFFSYVEFSSMYTFADMINYEKSDKRMPFVKRDFVLPASFYTKFGSVIFTIVLIVNFITIAALIITMSITNSQLIILPLIPLAISVISVLYTYVHYYVRYKAIGDLMDILSSKEISEPLRQRLAENKPGNLRTYCYVLAFLTVVISIALIAFLIIFFGTVSKLGLFYTLGFIFGVIIEIAIVVISLGIFGCYVDNIAKMLERYQIKYKII